MAEKFDQYPAKVVLVHLNSYVPPAKALKGTKCTVNGNDCPVCDSGKIEADLEIITPGTAAYNDNGEGFCNNCGAIVWSEEVKLKTKIKYQFYYKLPLKPANNPEYEITFDENHIDLLVQDLQYDILQFRVSEATGKWPQTRQRGWMSPCKFCDFQNHCLDRICCNVKYDNGGTE